MIKPQDIVVLVKLAIEPEDYRWSYNRLAYELHMSVSEVHTGITRATRSRLFNEHEKRPIRAALIEFLIHGVKYAFAPTLGTLTRGVPTAFSIPALSSHMVMNYSEPIVWAHPEGTERGLALTPLYKSVPYAVAGDGRLHEALGILDAIRIGRAREVRLAEELLTSMICHNEAH